MQKVYHTIIIDCVTHLGSTCDRTRVSRGFARVNWNVIMTPFQKQFAILENTLNIW